MIVEGLLVLACLTPNGDSCGKTTEAYTRYYGLDAIIQEYGDKYPTASFIVGAVGLAREKRLYYKIYGPWHHNMQVEGGGVSQMLWFKKDF